MSEIKLASALPKGSSNGLDPIVAELVDRPDHTQVVIAIVDCQEIKTIPATGEVIPTMRIRRIEAITGADTTAARLMFRRATERRTNRVELPYQMEEDLAGVANREADA